MAKGKFAHHVYVATFADGSKMRVSFPSRTGNPPINRRPIDFAAGRRMASGQLGAEREREAVSAKDERYFETVEYRRMLRKVAQQLFNDTFYELDLPNIQLFRTRLPAHMDAPEIIGGYVEVREFDGGWHATGETIADPSFGDVVEFPLKRRGKTDLERALAA